MASVSNSVNFDRVQNVEVAGQTVINLVANTDVLRVEVAVETPQILGIRSGTSERLILLANATAASISLENMHPDADVSDRFRMKVSSLVVPAGRFVMLFHDFEHHLGWHVLTGGL